MPTQTTPLALYPHGVNKFVLIVPYLKHVAMVLSQKRPPLIRLI
jgi:hypothetical protein